MVNRKFGTLDSALRPRSKSELEKIRLVVEIWVFLIHLPSQKAGL